MSTNAHARLTAAIKAHYWINTQSCCSCGWGAGDLSDDLDFYAHLADVITSLEGVAVVETPEARHHVHKWTHFGSVAIYSEKPRVINIGVDDWCTPERAREYAAALLAAADHVDHLARAAEGGR